MLSAILPEATTLCGRRSLSRAGLDPKAAEQTVCPWHLQINSFFFFFFFFQCILNSILGVYPGEVHAQSSLAGYSSRGHRVRHNRTTSTHTTASLAWSMDLCGRKGTQTCGRCWFLWPVCPRGFLWGALHVLSVDSGLEA